MNDELVNTAYVVKARCAKDVNGKKGVYLVKNSGISFYSGVRFCHYCLYYGEVKPDDFDLLPAKYNKRKNATRLSAPVCSDLLKLYKDSLDDLTVYKRCLVRELNIKDAKKKLNTKKARKNRFLVQNISTSWTYNSNDVTRYHQEWQFAEPIKLKQAVKIAVARERLNNTKCRILMTGWRKLAKDEVKQLVTWH
ncbi:MAG: hypothetical protein HUJ64_08835 [Limosilactobacillus mucosae]|nr:hypothetical protein [Limosilactobacillus mucosae]